jgi:hypothetical protein
VTLLSKANQRKLGKEQASILNTLLLVETAQRKDIEAKGVKKFLCCDSGSSTLNR